MPTETVHTVVIGAGQAGLCVSWFLQREGIEHTILERDTVASSWRRRWDSFTLVTPNALNRLPELPSGGDPDGFLARDQVIAYLERFAASFDPPLRTGVHVDAVAPHEPSGRFRVRTNQGELACRNVVVATGTFHRPWTPPVATRLPAGVRQLHSSDYRRPDDAPGAVLVVGSGQSGAQIADELRAAGRTVHLAVGSAPRLPRRYRGRDTMRWLFDLGVFDRTVETLDTPADRFAAHPHVSGRDGGATLDLRAFARDGVRLLGRLTAVDGDLLTFDDGLHDRLRAADAFAERTKRTIDARIDDAGIEAPPPSDADLARTDFEPDEPPNRLSLEAAGVRTVIWATGYRFDFSWVAFPVFDGFGYPVQRHGATDVPGLYFAGLHWGHRQRSALLCGVAEGAERIAGAIAAAGTPAEAA